MNTHSRDADARMEILAANALRAGADIRTAKQILDAVTTDEGLAVLKHDPILDGYHAACGTACGILSEPPGTGAADHRCRAVFQCDG